MMLTSESLFVLLLVPEHNLCDTSEKDGQLLGYVVDYFGLTKYHLTAVMDLYTANI